MLSRPVERVTVLRRGSNIVSVGSAMLLDTGEGAPRTLMGDALFAIVLILAVWKLCELLYNPKDYNPHTGDPIRKDKRRG